MAKKPKKKNRQGNLAKGTHRFPDTPEPVADGEHVRLLNFGGAISAPVAGDYIILEWGEGSDWETIRAITHESDIKFHRESRQGDGAKYLRVTINNDDKEKPFFFWLDAVEAPPL